MIEDYQIVSVGARTSVGLNAESTAASVRAGIDQFREHPFIIDKTAEPVILAMDSQLDENEFGIKRMMELALSALHEVWIKLTEINNNIRALPIFLALPEFRPGWTAEGYQQFTASLKKLIDPKKMFLHASFPYGHAAGLIALNSAGQYLTEKQLPVAIVLGVDSYIELETLEWLDQNRQLSTSYNRGAFVPGEGAGAIAISSTAGLNQFNFSSLAKFSGLGVSQETKLIKTDSICLGEGLTNCVKKSLANTSSSSEKIQGIICDINGERYRAEEWGFVLLRLSDNFIDPTDYDFPATYWGDVGAASGILFLILASIAGQKSWAKGSRYFIWTSSESGYRAGVSISINLSSKSIAA